MNSIHGKKLNKGEWAEFYVMLKLLGEGKLYTANHLLQKNYQNYLDILKIIRQETESQVLEYNIDEDKAIVTIKDQEKQLVLASIPTSEFTSIADTLFNDLNNKKGRSLNAPDEVCDFAKIIYVNQPKAPAVKALKRLFGGKNDIFIEVRDGQTAIVSVMGFSIKSKFGQEPTLFNAGTSSQFLFKLVGCTDQKMNEFNAISDNGKRGWSKCKEYLSDNGIDLVYSRPANPIYEDNLSLIRESMAAIMATCFKDRLIGNATNHKVKETVERLIESNPLFVKNPNVYYEKAIKDFLIAGFTGMTAANRWNGREQVSGGYIVVMDNGDVLCYHSNDREAFREYLYRNTFFEYVSAEKYNWSYIVKDNEEYYLPLNASIRFNKQTR